MLRRDPYLLLSVLTLAAYLPVFFGDFVRLDDGFYVVHNPHVYGGFTRENVAWAFQTGYQSNWHPVTWLSHMLDAQIFGLRPWGHHLTNLLFHLANALILFGVLRHLTGALMRSWLVAALFALHPLHVESVAWVSERKDVLSAFFFLLTLWAYEKYARPSPEAQTQEPGDRTHSSKADLALGQDVNRRAFYFLALGFFALGLMSKPMLVTLPFILLLLDYWPLGRFRGAARDPDPGIPAAPPQSGSGEEAGNLAKLARQGARPARWMGLLMEKLPFFALATISSVVTFQVQANGHATSLVLPLSSRLANAVASYWRYIGKTVWPLDLAAFYPHPYARYSISYQWPGGLILLAAMVLAGVSLWVVLRRKAAGWLAVGWFWYLGTLVPVIGLVQVGTQAMADRYTYIPLIGLFVGVVWGADGFVRGWVSDSRIAVGIAGAAVLACAALTARQAAFWRSDLVLFQHALAVTGDSALAQFHVGTGLGEMGKFEEATRHFEAAVRADPTFAPPYFSLGLIADAEGRPEEAIARFRRVIELQPDSAPGYYQLAWLLAAHPSATVRNGAEAVRLAERARDLTGGSEPHYLAALDAAYAEAGRFDDAIRTADKVRDLALTAGNQPLAAEAEARLALYARKQPYRRQ